MDKKIIAIAAVIVVVAVAAVAVFSMSGNGSQELKDPTEYPATYMTVLGNVNSDVVINEEDAIEIQKFVDAKETEKPYFKYEDYYMYDANRDGKIDQADVDKVKLMVAAQKTGNWSAVGTVYYVNVDLHVASYDMTKNNKVITLIAPPLDTVLAIGGKDLVVGTDNRITTGKFHAEYYKTLDFDNLFDVGSCNEPSTEVITNASLKYGGVNIVCGVQDTYGPTLEKTFKGTDVQVIRIASWEYGGTLYGLHTLGFLLKKVDGALDYYEGYCSIADEVEKIVTEVPASKKAPGKVGAAAAYGYNEELSLLGEYTGEFANLMTLDPFDSATPFLGGQSGGHGNTITTEGVVAMYQQYNLINLLLMIGTPFQVTTGGDDAQSSAAYMKNLYNVWDERIGAEDLENLNMCITGYSFSSGVSEVLNRAIHCYYLYNEEFLAHFGCTTQKQAQDVLAGYVDWYCQSIGIDDAWSFYGEANGGKAGTLGMNLLYCGEGDDRNILYGLDHGHAELE